MSKPTRSLTQGKWQLLTKLLGDYPSIELHKELAEPMQKKAAKLIRPERIKVFQRLGNTTCSVMYEGKAYKLFHSPYQPNPSMKTCIDLFRDMIDMDEDKISYAHVEGKGNERRWVYASTPWKVTG